MNKPEPPTTACPIAAAVAADVLARAEVGLRKYGVSLARPDLSRAQWLQHAYEEALDLAAYLRTLIEMEKADVTKPETTTRPSVFRAPSRADMQAAIAE
jgi:hypothetical protein